MERPITEAEIFDLDTRDVFRDTQTIKLLEEASLALGEVNNYASGAIEYDFVVETLRNIESLTSAKIEGTTGNLHDLYAEQSLSYERKAQLKLFSAINYKSAMDEVEDIIKTYKSLSIRFVRHLHKILTENDPATSGVPGAFRKHQVVIENSKLGDFWPADPMKITEFMDRFVKATHERHSLPQLINTAISHYQFESIHPFADGNGRTGRMLIVTDLLMGKLISFPVLNLSQYFERNRDAYIRALRLVTEERSLTPWVRFFLQGVRDQSRHNLTLVEQLRAIEQADLALIHEHLHSPVPPIILRHALNSLFITVESATEYVTQNNFTSTDTKQTVRVNIARLVELGVLEETDFKRGRQKVYGHRRLKKFLKGDSNTK